MMEDWIQSGYPRSPEIAAVVDEIAHRFSNAQIYLFSQKFSAAGETASFKLCVIYDFGDKTAAERIIYMDIDSDVPFDVVLYTFAEWNQLCGRPDSFAHKVYMTGTVVYG